MELHDQIKTVHDQQSFLVFVEALIKDHQGAVGKAKVECLASPDPDVGGWQNLGIANFLDAAVSWAEDTDFGQSQGLSLNNPWQQFAAFLYCGKIYE